MNWNIVKMVNFMLNKFSINIAQVGTPRWLSGWAPAFGSGRDPRVLGSSPMLGSPQGVCFSLCLCLFLCVFHE